MEGCIVQFQRLCQSRSRRLVSVMALILSVLLVFQAFTLPSKRIYSTQYPSSKLPKAFDGGSLNKEFSSQSQRVGKPSLFSNSHGSVNFLQLSKKPDLDSSVSEIDGELQNNDSDDGNWLDDDENPDTEFSGDLRNETILKKDLDNGFLFMEDGNSKGNSHLAVEKTRILDNELMSMQGVSSVNSSKNAILSEETEADIATLLNQQGKQELSDNESFLSSESFLAQVNVSASNVTILNKKNILMKLPLSMSEMNSLFFKNRASRRSMRPRWSSAHDRQILAAKTEIENVHISENDRQLFAPLYRNISKFKRSYKLMEKTLKIYIYQEGEKPIFHQPILKGIYAAEGWFMKLMESNKHYLVKDPSQAHLFYMPFSSRLLQLALYVPDSHNRTNMRRHLQNYLHMIAAKYPFWNRTGGADHFLVACHDWALNVTKIMDHSIRALCVADISIGFELGRDVCLPETNVRSLKNPLKDLGGRPWNRRPTLAFFAGNLHGGFRSILLKHWENKDPDMKIFGPSTFRVGRRKMTYIQYMKSSKYCICPRGYEVNSPRIVESIFFECVPVIIADNYVPPFFEILNWEKFSVIVPEKDLRRLKEILLSITESEYRELQMGVKKVQRHFLWSNKPVKYDLFHMILHSIWLNRVYNIESDD
ncbi:probable glycosyltransferase At3g07620 [Dendrobium catenatum]|uniref:Putative glycosyltransferase n=1 Tax=Dendrobium catenatum TaxID=906689 RepID=A0A2I0W678_9ASPA|nr:probable glycosyltransferase At3g07620 [Dendrobium catenatum]XP_028554147.1 probable glycosyltransferase At3g07620 [Dendrobium catenatum]PKU71167.1 putative glycosyltransferase [Dendrobium catenatum]